MARDTAGKWILGLVIYFIVISVTLTFINQAINEYEISDSSVTYSTGSLGKSLNNLGGCDDPRSINENEPDCKYLLDIGSVHNNETCGDVEGCTWKKESSFFSWGESSYTCDGVINQTYYNNGANYTTFNIFGNWADSVCGLYNLSQDQDMCQFFGCTWTSQTTDDYIKVSKLAESWNIVKDIFTANINFGSSSQSVNTMLNFIFIVFPIVILLLAIVMFLLG